MPTNTSGLQPNQNPDDQALLLSQANASAEQTKLYNLAVNPQTILGTEFEKTKLAPVESNQPTSIDQTKLTPVSQSSKLIEQTRSKVRDVISYDPTDESVALTTVKDLNKLKTPKLPDTSGTKTSIPPEMFESTEILLTDKDKLPGTISETSELDETTFLHPKYVEDYQSKVDLLAEDDVSPTKVEVFRRTLPVQSESSDQEPQISYSEIPSDTYGEYDLLPTEELTISEFVQKKSLHSNDMDALLNHLQNNFNYQPLWQFINKMARDPYDVAIIKRNINIMTTGLLNSILLLSAVRHDYFDEDLDQDRQVLVYAGPEMGSGTIGVVNNIYYCYDDSLELREGLYKSVNKSDPAKPEQVQMALILAQAFKLETQTARKLKKLFTEKAGDPRLKQILHPEFVADDFLIIPKITNELGESHHMANVHKSPKFMVNGQFSIEKYCQSLAGSAQGLDFLSENNIIVGDNKPQNMIDSVNGAVLIDLGGFVDLENYRNGTLKISESPQDGSLVTSFYFPESPSLQTTLPVTDSYGNMHLLSQEIRGEKPNDLTHKLTLAKCIERLFCLLKFSPLEKFKEKGRLFPIDRLNAPAVSLNAELLSSPALQNLYKLYLKLYYAHQHPYKFIDNDQAKGLDLEYITLEQTAVALNNINNSQSNV